MFGHVGPILGHVEPKFGKLADLRSLLKNRGNIFSRQETPNSGASWKRMYDNVNDYDDDDAEDDDDSDDDDDDDDGDDVDGEDDDDDDDDGDDDDGGDDDDDADDKVNDDKVKYNDVEKDDDDDDTLCASLCGRNACQDFTRATLYGDSQEKCRNPD